MPKYRSLALGFIDNFEELKMSRSLGLKPEDGLEIPCIRDNLLEKLSLNEGENYGYYKGLITVEKGGKTVRILQFDQTVTHLEI